MLDTLQIVSMNQITLLNTMRADFQQTFEVSRELGQKDNTCIFCLNETCLLFYLNDLLRVLVHERAERTARMLRDVESEADEGFFGDGDPCPDHQDSS